MNSGKAFANTLIDTTVVVLCAAIARAALAICKKGGKLDPPKLDFEVNSLWKGAIFLTIVAAGVQPYIIGTYYLY